ADLMGVTWRHAGFVIDAPRLTNEADEHRYDAEVHDVATVAAAALGEQSPECDKSTFRFAALDGGALARTHTPIELLHDHGNIEANQGHGQKRQGLLQGLQN